MTLTNPPFLRQRGAPPLHLRPWSIEEFDQARRMIAAREAMRKAAYPRKDAREPKQNAF